jgi:hypothetical protein
MAFVDPRRLAAVDMHGLHGNPMRAKVIRLEFIVGASGALALGGASLVASEGIGRLLGAWLLGVGLNYVPLALYAQRLSRPGALEAELAGVEDFPAEARRVGMGQFWILMPLAVVIGALLS